MTGFELRIDSIAGGGDGVGRNEGMVVFVPRSAPGDVLRVSAIRNDRLMRGTIERIIQPSPDRVEPPCVHYTRDRCGGCQLQHLEYPAQLRAKSGIIADSLNRIGKLNVERPEVRASSHPWRYRRKLTLAVRRQGDGWIAGLRRFDNPDDVFNLVDCPITSAAVLGYWHSVLAHPGYLPKAEELRASVRTMSDGFSFVVEGARAWPDSDRLFGAVEGMRELWWQPEGQRRRLLHARAAEHAEGASFVQVNPHMAAQLREWVVSLVTAQRPRTAVDAYSGSGDLAVMLADQGIRVTAIEIDRDAARVAGARLPEGSRVIAEPVERAIGRTLPADIVIVNPPRGGLDVAVAATLRSCATPPRRVIYISCNPATLARDVRRMERYEVRSLRGFDMFPQTAHVETVCELAAA